jgi:hypothetical protein
VRLPASPSGWRRYFVYRTECLKTTWLCRLAILTVIAISVVGTAGLWARPLARSLMCPEDVRRSDAILVENFDPTYVVFERAAALQQAGFASLVFAATEASHDNPAEAGAVPRGITQFMANFARVANLRVIPTRDIEPISLNAAYQIRDVLVRERLTSVIVVAPAFRSRRSLLIYRSVLGPSGIRVHCVPAMGTNTPENWTRTWHGIQEVTEQFVKLQYYRFSVLPRSRMPVARSIT